MKSSKLPKISGYNYMNEVEKKTEPIVIDRDEVIQTKGTPFLLHDGDFLRLTKIHSFLAVWAHSFFAGTGVFLVTLISKWINHKYFNSEVIVSSQEWITLSILVVLVLVSESLHFYLPSEKKKTVKRIQKHFSKHKQV